MTSFGTTGGGDAGLNQTPGKVQKAWTATTTSALSFGSAPASTISFGVTSTSQPTTASNAVSATPATTTDGQKQTETIKSLSTATKTTDSSAANQTPSMTFCQLEEQVNKWTLELEEQEKIFTNQATQINAWDKLLISNNEKIIALNDAVQKVKADQQTLEQELELIATQQTELEESIVPLQKDFLNMTQVDIERSQTYLLVENLDTQLKQMSEDLKEVIDHLNEANKIQNSTDPMVQIGKILNAHMNSLQWIELSSSEVASKLEDIAKMHESLRRDSERSFRLTYD